MAYYVLDDVKLDSKTAPNLNLTRDRWIVGGYWWCHDWKRSSKNHRNEREHSLSGVALPGKELERAAILDLEDCTQ
ncbi:hypothetical protein PAAG_00928 [Paracoccidioides lutzii Pb01]|uniref:Uncharacterized protein n=1 Tax=Paracoccidioides lutzii (strain ATCC MYA-826 / Pb01) TaxID=502779 RepID=C1GQY3_PARBA|nr:hypothetical protein PAAG_00928 [Paracoccidioides lutzii Pb01]EEH38007.2 hypothetical protein PAAG_00928 [Paracoccidioides lutzii Pb01]